MKVKLKYNLEDTRYTVDFKKKYGYPFYESFKYNYEYPVIAIYPVALRVLDESLDLCIYPIEMFEIIDHTIPDDWVKNDYEGSDGEMLSAYNPPFVGEIDYFWEEFYDGNIEAIKLFYNYITTSGLITKEDLNERLKRSNDWAVWYGLLFPDD